MSSIIKREISPRTQGRVAIALSTIALFTTAGGPAWAQGVITGRDIADDTITNHDIADDNLDASSLAPGSVTDSEIGYWAVRPHHVPFGSLGADKIADNSLTGEDIKEGSIFQNDLGDSSVNTAELYTWAVTKDKLDTAAVTRRSTDLRTSRATFTATMAPNRCVMGMTPMETPSLAVFQPQLEGVTYPYTYSGLVITAWGMTTSNGSPAMVNQICNLTGGQFTPPAGGLKVRVQYIA